MQINVLEYFEKKTLHTHKKKIAVVDKGRSYTFEMVEVFAKKCAAMLLEKIDLTSQCIAVFLPKSIETIVADLGVLYSGNCYANLDVKSPLERLRATFKNLECPLIITTSEYVDVLMQLGVLKEQLVLIEKAFDDEKNYNNEKIFKKINQIIDNDPFCIIHTSGSTGTPKGVALSHRGAIDYMDWVFETFAFDNTQIIGSLSPCFFDTYTLELFLCLAKGATFIIIPEQLAAFPVRLLEFIISQKVNFIFWVPTIMVNIANQNLLEKFSLDAIKTIFFAGEVFPTKHLNYWRRYLGNTLFVNLYGPTEANVDCTYFIVNRPLADEDKLPLGFPCRNTDILILNESNREVQNDEIGELCIRGSSLALGYWNNPELTAKVFVQNPLNKHYPELIYRTGDLVYRNFLGEIMFKGRKDHQIKHLGYRIELGEIEHAALLIDGIHNCCSVYNQSKKEIILFFESTANLTTSNLRENLASFIPKYMLPRVFKKIEKLPINANGKIDRSKLLNTLDA
ncbi:MAG: amino acid adenylation domain-containing protein [Pseudomonadota bacterium]